MGRRTNAGRDPLAAPAEGGSGQSEASRTGPVTEGMEPRVLWAETGSDRVHERTGLLVGRREETKTDGVLLKSKLRGKTQRCSHAVRDVYMRVDYM